MDDIEPKFELCDTGFAVVEPVPYFAVMLREPNRVRLVNVGPELVRVVQERLEQLVPVETFGYVVFKDYAPAPPPVPSTASGGANAGSVPDATSGCFTGRFNIYDVVLDRGYFERGGSTVTREDMTLIQVVFCRVLGALFCHGYDAVTSSDVARDLRTHSAVFFRLRDPHDHFALHYQSHKFICVAPFAHDNILLINVPKVAVEPIIKTIHLTWSPGIKSKQTLADDDRSVSVVLALKLCGSPWGAAQSYSSSGKAAIQARMLIVEVAKVLATFKWRFALNVNFNGGTDSFFFQWCPYLEFEEQRYCALMLSRYDRLRLLGLPASLVSVVKDCANKYWHMQLLKQREYHGAVELKLGGCPWWADGNDAVEARYFVSCLVGAIRASGWEVCGSVDLVRHATDKATLLLRQSAPQTAASATASSPHMCICLSKSNRIRLIVSSSDISEEAELRLTTRMNEVIKQHWVALGPRNFGKSIEWKLEGDPWDTEGLYADQTRGVFLLCLLLNVVQPMGWHLVASADVASKNLDANERGYAMVGKPEDLATWFFTYDEALRRDSGSRAGNLSSCSSNNNPMDYAFRSNDITGSTSVPNLDMGGGGAVLAGSATPMGGYYGHYGQGPSQQPVYADHNSLLQQQQQFSRSVPSVAAMAAQDPYFQPPLPPTTQPQYGMVGMPVYGATGQRPFSRADPMAFAPQPTPQPQMGAEYLTRPTSSFRPAPPPMMAPPAHQQQYPDPACFANASRCQRKQKMLLRQASAGSLPPESMHNHGHNHGGHHGHHQNVRYGDDIGYKSDGEGYKSDLAFRSFNDHDEEEEEVTRKHVRSAAGGFWHESQRAQQQQQQQQQQPMRSHSSMRNNGYVSDGEGYLASGQQNRRVSRSGKFGSQASSICGVGTDASRHHKPGMDHHHDDDEDDDDDVERELEAQRREQQLRTPDSEDEDELILARPTPAEAMQQHQQQQQQQQQQQMGPVRRSASNTNGYGMISQQQQQQQHIPQQQQPTTSRRGSRSNNAGAGATHSGSDRSDSQMGGYRSEQSAGSAGSGAGAMRPPNDGYRSEGSTDSPRQKQNQQQMRDADLITVLDGGMTSGDVMNQQQQQPRHRQMAPPVPKHKSTAVLSRSKSRDRSGSGAGGNGAAGGSAVNNSKSLTSFERQESTTSFHSGHSTHSAPPCCQVQPGQPMQPHSHRHMVGAGGQYPPPQQQYHPHYHPGHHPQQHHMAAMQQQQGYCMVPQGPPFCGESCSTQSSSSSASASAPPDYATCSGMIPPTYDQALEVRHRAKRQQSQQQHVKQQQQQQPPPMAILPTRRAAGPTKQASVAGGGRSNEFYYVGEFYG